MIVPPELHDRYVRAEAEVRVISKLFAGSRTLLDIGCGPAVTSVWLAEVMNLDHLYLMDGGVSRRREESWYEGEPQAWADMSLTRQVVADNHVSATIMPSDPSAYVKCDAIMSLLSWGHHYPVEVYRELVLRSGATKIVLDLRKGKGGYNNLVQYFPRAECIDETAKTERWFFKR